MTGVFEDHLGLDAIVAYVDGELGLTAFQRASAHVSRCEQCAAEVSEQTAAQQCLRTAGLPRMPGSLFDALKSIPVALPNPRPVPGVMVDSISGRVRRDDTAVGQSVALPSRPDPGRGRRFRLGAGALVAGIAMGAVVAAAAGEHTQRNPGPTLHPDVARVSGGPTRPAVSMVPVKAVNGR